MARIDPDPEEKPLDPATERVRQRIVRFMAINLGVLLLALMAVGLALVYKWNQPAEPQEIAGQPEIPEGAVIEAAVPLPPGTRITGHSLSGDRISFDTIRPDGRREIVIYDIRGGRIAARLAVPTAP